MMAATRPLSLLDRLPPSRGRLSAQAPLADKTWFRVGGPAEVFFRPADALDLATFLAGCPADVPVSVIGAASNLIVRDGGIAGVVVRLARGFSAIAVEPDGVVVGAGALDATVAEHAAEAGLAGLEFLSGIPGTIGGAVVYNAGAYGGCLADVLRRVRLQLPGDSDQWVDASELGLVYRGSAFTRREVEGKAVLEAELELAEGDAKALLARAASYDEKRLTAQPRGRNAGSTFKNPPDSPAWKLIEAVGLRGMKRGEAAISDKHCNFFVNDGNATAADVAWLIAEAQRRVNDQFGVSLEREVEFVGEW